MRRQPVAARPAQIAAVSAFFRQTGGIGTEFVLFKLGGIVPQWWKLSLAKEAT